MLVTVEGQALRGTWSWKQQLRNQKILPKKRSTKSFKSVGGSESHKYFVCSPEASGLEAAQDLLMAALLLLMQLLHSS